MAPSTLGGSSPGPVPASGAARQRFYFQFITEQSSDTSGACILLHFDQKRYLFGDIPEGLQRACIQQSIGLKKLRHIFVGGKPCSRHNNGLLGLILTLSDVQAESSGSAGEPRPRLHIHSGPSLVHKIACARRFIFRTGMPLSVHDNLSTDAEGAGLLPSFVDENIKVWSFALSKKDLEGEAENSGDDSRTDEDFSPLQEEFEMDHREFAEEQTLRKTIVNDMFDSGWRKDKLVESQFKDVRMPATVWVRDPQLKTLLSYYCVSHDSAPQLTPETNVLVRDPWPSSLVANLPPPNELHPSEIISYIVKGHPQRGKLDFEKATSLGIKPGPILAQLASGISVTLPSGEVITPEMVLGPQRPGKGMAFVWGASRGRPLSNIVDMLLGKYGSIMSGVETICWMTNIPFPEYKNNVEQLLRRFQGIQHIYCAPSRDDSSITFDSSAASTIKLAHICPQHFEALRYTSRAPHKDALCMVAERGLKIQVEPEWKFDRTSVQRFNSEACDQVSATALALLRSEQDLNLTSGSFTQHSSVEEPEIITLGTGSASPSKYRNVSATLLRIPGLGNYLFDCGENTYGQLNRMYDRNELADILRDLRFIWISHLHADHHLGTETLISHCNAVMRDSITRSHGGSTPRGMVTQMIQDKPLKIISDVDMLAYLAEITPKRRHEPIVQRPAYGATLHDSPFDFKTAGIGVQKLESTYVSHCRGAQAVSVTFDTGFKFSYSGDCRPSKKFAIIGADSDVLVHEATFDDDMEGDARAKKHSTTSEALGVALQMRAKNVVLTHFSQRYQKIPNLNNVKPPEQIKFEEGSMLQALGGPVEEFTDAAITEGSTEAPIKTDTQGPEKVAENTTEQFTEQGDPIKQPTAQSNTLEYFYESARSADKSIEPSREEMNIGVAFDYMRIKVSDIKNMKLYYPAIEKMFEEQREEVDTDSLNGASEVRQKQKTKGGKGKNGARNGAGVKSDATAERNQTQKGGDANARKRQAKQNVAGESGNSTRARNYAEKPRSPGFKKLRLDNSPEETQASTYEQNNSGSSPMDTATQDQVALPVDLLTMNSHPH